MTKLKEVRLLLWLNLLMFHHILLMQHKFEDVEFINRVENKKNKPNNTHVLYTSLCHYFVKSRMSIENNCANLANPPKWCNMKH